MAQMEIIQSRKDNKHIFILHYNDSQRYAYTLQLPEQVEWEMYKYVIIRER